MSMDDSYESPDGLFRVDLAMFEMRMSHWVMNPRVTHVPSGQVLLDLWGSLWDGTPEQTAHGQLDLALREYPGRAPGYALRWDAGARTVTRTEGDRSETTPW
jgi:hypothetical protein